MGLTQRRARTNDASEILALINDPASPHRQESCCHREDPEEATMLFDRLDEDENLVLVEGGQIVAYASWQVFAAHAHLNVLAVAGAQQRRGLGKRLFEAFLAELREDHIESYTLRAYKDSAWAMAFYERLGLAPCEAPELLVPRYPGLAHYVSMALASGQWPVTEKALFFDRV